MVLVVTKYDVDPNRAEAYREWVTDNYAARV